MKGASGDGPDATEGSGDADESTDPAEASDGRRADDTREDDPADRSPTDPEADQASEPTEPTAGDDQSGNGTDERPDADGADDGPVNAMVTAGESASTAATEIDPSELTVSERSLHPRIRTIWLARAVLWSLVLGGIAFAATWQWLETTLLVPAAITAALLALFVTHAFFRYRAWQYEFREDAIYLERGVLTRVRTVVPFVRIQHVDTARGPIARAAGLSTLVVYTAGSRGADVTIPGIDADRATDHQRRLKQLAIAAEDDTAV